MHRAALQVGPGRRSDSATTFPPLSPIHLPERPSEDISRKARIDFDDSVSKGSISTNSKDEFSIEKRFFHERETKAERERGRGEDVAEEGFPGRAVSAAVRSFPWREGRVSLAFTALGVEGKGEVGARWGLGGGGRRDVDGLAALPGRRVAG